MLQVSRREREGEGRDCEEEEKKKKKRRGDRQMEKGEENAGVAEGI